MKKIRVFTALLLAFLFGFTPVATLAGCAPTNNYVAAFKGPELNVINYGAIPNDNLNDTTAFSDAITALGAAGGVVLIPPGKYCVNLSIQASNVKLQGMSSSTDATTNALVPWDIAQPVIKIGNDAAYIRGTAIDRVNLYATGPNGNGAVGLQLSGGAYQSRITNLTAQAFTQNCVRLIAGATYPIAYTVIDGLVATTASATNAATVYVGAGSSDATANFISHASISSPAASGRAIEIDSAYAFLSDAWVQCGGSDRGIKFTMSGAALPKLITSNVAVDSNSGSDSLVETYNTDANIGSVMPGAGYTVDGLFKLSNATTSAIPGLDSIPRLNLGNTWGGLNTFSSINSVGNFSMTSGGYISIGNGQTAYRNQSTSSVYSTSTGGGAYPYTEAGHEVLEPCLNGAVRSVIVMGSGGVPVLVANGGGNVSIGKSGTGSARLELPAGTATAGTAPLLLNAGTSTTVAVPGQIEYDGSNLLYTITGPLRRTVANLEAAQTWAAAQTFTLGGLIATTAAASSPTSFFGLNAANNLYIDTANGPTLTSTANVLTLIDNDNNSTSAFWGVAANAANNSGSTSVARIYEDGRMNLAQAGSRFAIGAAGDPTEALEVTGNVRLTTAGNGIKIKTGTNATMGRTTLVGGTVTVATTKATATANIILTTQVPGGTIGHPVVVSRVNNTSFTIESRDGAGALQAADTSTVAWVIFEEAP